MLRLFLLLILSTCLISCKERSNTYENIDIVILEYDTYEYNLSKMTYTIFNDTKPPQVVNFSLTKDEKDKLGKSYYEFGLNNFSDITLIEDECFVAPKFATTILVKSKNRNQEIEIDSDCDNFLINNFQQAYKVKAFLNLIDIILKSKPEIKNAPKTDKIYE